MLLLTQAQSVKLSIEGAPSPSSGLTSISTVRQRKQHCRRMPKIVPYTVEIETQPSEWSVRMYERKGRDARQVKESYRWSTARRRVSRIWSGGVSDVKVLNGQGFNGTKVEVLSLLCSIVALNVVRVPCSPFLHHTLIIWNAFIYCTTWLHFVCVFGHRSYLYRPSHTRPFLRLPQSVSKYTDIRLNSEV